MDMSLYANRPRPTGSSPKDGTLAFLPDESVVFSPALGDSLGATPIVVPPERIHDLVLPTMLGLLEDLTPGSTVIDEFLAEWERVQVLLGEPESPAWRAYGEWFYFPADARLARFAPRRWHRLALQVRNATLMAVPGLPHDWAAGRARLDPAVLAIAGCSVGSNVLHSSTMLMRPSHVKVADVKDYNLNNGNRVRFTYRDLGRNKAQVCAEQLHAIDPFLGVSVYDTGIDAQTVERFIGGDPTSGEPAATLVLEETDDPPVKVCLRQAARAARVPLVMVTDLGRVVSIDVRRFDLDAKLPMCHEVPDDVVLALLEQYQRGTGEREVFIEMAYAFSGRDEVVAVTDFREVALREVLTPFAGFPQLGSTAGMAGGLAAWIISQIHLGHPVWERMTFDPMRATVTCKGKCQ